MRYLFLLLSCAVAYSQNFALRLGSDMPTNSWEVSNGITANVLVEQREIGTNSTPPAGFSRVMTTDQVQQWLVNHKAEQDSWALKVSQIQSNQQWQAQQKVDASLTRIVQLYGMIPQARATLGTFEAGWQKGTNYNLAQLNYIVREQNRDVAGMLELQQRLGPVLKEMYDANKDDAN